MLGRSVHSSDELYNDGTSDGGQDGSGNLYHQRAIEVSRDRIQLAANFLEDYFFF